MVKFRTLIDYTLRLIGLCNSKVDDAMLNTEQDLEGCDATGFHSSNADWPIKNRHIFMRGEV